MGSKKLTELMSILDDKLSNRSGWGSSNNTSLNETLKETPSNALNTKDSLQTTINEILNGKKFEYDLNGDALYQQYKDKYIQQGKLAMGDAIGQASAMTGGYGNSYAQSVGQQAYQASLDNLNDIVPELYQMAYDRYNTDKQDLYNKYGLLASERADEYARERDKIEDERWEKQFDYSKYIDDRDFKEAKRQFDLKYGVEDPEATDLHLPYIDSSGMLNNWSDTYKTYVADDGWGYGKTEADLKPILADDSKIYSWDSAKKKYVEKSAPFNTVAELDSFLMELYEADDISEDEMGELYIKYSKGIKGA